jgi:hypothetical protein
MRRCVRPSSWNSLQTQHKDAIINLDIISAQQIPPNAKQRWWWVAQFLFDASKSFATSLSFFTSTAFVSSLQMNVTLMMGREFDWWHHMTTVWMTRESRLVGHWESIFMSTNFYVYWSPQFVRDELTLGFWSLEKKWFASKIFSPSLETGWADQ